MTIMQKQQTIKKRNVLQRHRAPHGQPVNGKIYSRSPGQRVCFIRTDLPGKTRIPATIDYVTGWCAHDVKPGWGQASTP